MKYLLCILPAFFWAGSDFLSRISSSKITSTAGTLILTLGMIVGILCFSLFNPTVWKEISLENTKPLLTAFLGGILNVAGFYFFFRFLQSGGNFTQGLPIILVLVAMFAVLFGIFFFRDELNWRIFLGITFGLGAIYLLNN